MSKTEAKGPDSVKFLLGKNLMLSAGELKGILNIQETFQIDKVEGSLWKENMQGKRERKYIVIDCVNEQKSFLERAVRENGSLFFHSKICQIFSMEIKESRSG